MLVEWRGAGLVSASPPNYQKKPPCQGKPLKHSLKCNSSLSLPPVYADTDTPRILHVLLLPLQVLNIRFNKDTGGETIEIT